MPGTIAELNPEDLKGFYFIIFR